MGLGAMAKRVPVLGPLAARVYRRFVPYEAPPFRGSAAYWEQRYRTGGNSGVGSYDRFAEFKAEVLNGLVASRSITSVIEFGCGDGNQLRLARYPRYLGVDVSATAVETCRRLFASDPTKRFATVEAYTGETADLALSLDVIYHLVEDDVFERYMQQLFAAATRYVCIYASNTDEDLTGGAAHVRGRQFTSWVEAHAPGWQLVEHVPNRYPYRGDYQTGSFSEFFVYERRPVPPA